MPNAAPPPAKAATDSPTYATMPIVYVPLAYVPAPTNPLVYKGKAATYQPPQQTYDSSSKTITYNPLPGILTETINESANTITYNDQNLEKRRSDLLAKTPYEAKQDLDAKLEQASVSESRLVSIIEGNQPGALPSIDSKTKPNTPSYIYNGGKYWKKQADRQRRMMDPGNTTGPAYGAPQVLPKRSLLVAQPFLSTVENDSVVEENDGTSFNMLQPNSSMQQPRLLLLKNPENKHGWASQHARATEKGYTHHARLNFDQRYSGKQDQKKAA